MTFFALRQVTCSRSVIFQFLLNVSVVGALDEVQMFEEVRHSGFAIPLMAGADEIDHIHRDDVAS